MDESFDKNQFYYALVCKWCVYTMYIYAVADGIAATIPNYLAIRFNL